MHKKGNLVSNWNESYKDLPITYDERLISPGNIANYMQFQFVYDDIQKFLGGIKKPRILEVGCGGARASLFLALRGFDVTCTDNSAEAIRLAQANFASKNSKGAFIIDDLLNSSLPAASYDCVMSFGLLEHFENIAPVINSITNLVKPNGIQIHCVIPKKISTESVMNIAWYPVRFLTYVIKRDFKDIFVKSYRYFPHYENSFSAKEYCRVFMEEGNSIIRCEAGGWVLPFITPLPFGFGNFLVKKFSGALSNLIKKTDRSESKILHFLSPTFLIVCRKNKSLSC